LLGLLGAEAVARLDGPMTPMPIEPVGAERLTWEIRIDRDRKTATLAGLGKMRGAHYQMLEALADTHLEALGKGMAAEDSPTMEWRQLETACGAEGDEAVRRRVLRQRRR
jgi:hypothetical protein